jgi:hypothetical protein
VETTSSETDEASDSPIDAGTAAPPLATSVLPLQPPEGFIPVERIYTAEELGLVLPGPFSSYAAFLDPERLLFAAMYVGAETEAYLFELQVRDGTLTELAALPSGCPCIVTVDPPNVVVVDFNNITFFADEGRQRVNSVTHGGRLDKSVAYARGSSLVLPPWDVYRAGGDTTESSFDRMILFADVDGIIAQDTRTQEVIVFEGLDTPPSVIAESPCEEDLNPPSHLYYRRGDVHLLNCFDGLYALEDGAFEPVLEGWSITSIGPQVAGEVVFKAINLEGIDERYLIDIATREVRPFAGPRPAWLFADPAGVQFVLGTYEALRFSGSETISARE